MIRALAVVSALHQELKKTPKQSLPMRMHSFNYDKIVQIKGWLVGMENMQV